MGIDKIEPIVAEVRITLRADGGMNVKHPDDVAMTLALLGEAVKTIAHQKIKKEESRIQVVKASLGVR